MKSEAVLKLFRDRVRCLKGISFFPSGLHSRNYLQCARVNGRKARSKAKILAGKVKQEINKEIDYVVSPMGGVIADEMGRQLGVLQCSFTRKWKITFRRGFELEIIQGRKPIF